MRSAFGLLAVGLSVAVAGPALAQGATPAGQRAPTAVRCTATEFSGKAYTLASAFDPDKYGKDYVAPVLGSPASAQIQSDLQAAFAVAPDFFKKDLCKLDHVFIETDSYDWGMYEAIDQRTGNRQGQGKRVLHRYIGISQTWWRNGTLGNLTSHETIFNNTFTPTLNPAPIVYSGAGSADTPSMALLSILAHEMGHIIWYLRPEDRDDCTIASTANVDFFYGSWDDVERPDRFHKAGVAAAVSTHAVAADPSLEKILADQSNPALLNADLALIYGSGRWLSLFSAVAPDEDFAETYKLVVLENAIGTPLQSLTATINRAAYDIAGAAGANSVLHDKVSCLKSTYTGTP